jgi:hypothetical protein
VVPHDFKSVAVLKSVRGYDHEPVRLAGASVAETIVYETHITQDAGADTWTEPWFAAADAISRTMMATILKPVLL